MYLLERKEGSREREGRRWEGRGGDVAKKKATSRKKLENKLMECIGNKKVYFLYLA